MRSSLLEPTRESQVACPSDGRSPASNRKARGLFERHATLAVLAGCLILVTALAWGNRGFTFDDPGIFWRYAEHLATGAGWDYNLGQAGTANAITSPLYLLVLTLGRLLAGAGSLPAVSTVLFVVCLAGAAATTFAGLRTVGHPVAGVIAAILVCTSPLVFITRGMESSLYLLLVALALLAFVKERPWWCGLALGALILTRPDGALLAVALGACALLRYRRLPLAMFFGAAALVVPWLVYAEVRFGSIYPSTLLAKTAQGHSGLLVVSFLHGLWVIPAGYSLGWFELLVLPALGGLVVLVRERALDRWMLPLVGFTIALVIGYVLLGVPGLYEWYYALPAYTFVVSGALGLEWLVVSRRAKGIFLGCLMVGALGWVGFREIPAGLPSIRTGYQSVGLWLRSNTPPDATVAFDEIGLVGYYSGRPMVDFLGLFSASQARAVARGDLVSWVARDQPDYVVVAVPVTGYNAGFEAFTHQPWFPSDFRVVHRVDNLVVYQRIAVVP